MSPLRTVFLGVAFLRDLTLSSVAVARAVVDPRRAAPGFVTVPLTLARTDVEITLVANYITLTPGTLTVDVSADRRTLLVHALEADEAGIRADIAAIEVRVTGATR
ncbi:multisubunit Na+/H+ antiporter MnhE subunit [Amaricoccus macauensis]|uniref:Multisubunit Na+/H+ antiporter MnhE subunit n=1 Tax=Amaricoccus macauensis TaxID=57001 RepID=A0A840SLC9_9RHOB|nr:Na+/H+ antiporter subunit E [Amaricoccus macauensis]MBB5220988.1 multisubunit Na+/H+ antiporter MnhE subunit [Amaricoccus macauensis]